jgi:hypothetical protein
MKVVRCMKCGLRWLSPIKLVEEYARIYKSSYFKKIPEDYEEIA